MERFLHFDGLNIYYSVEGDGIAVMLVHGFGETGEIWMHQGEFLKKHCKVIIPDLPGSGKSKADTKSLSKLSDIRFYADCVHALLMHEKISACIMIGHSMGGYITLAFAKKYSEMLEAFGWLNSTAFADREEKKESRRKGIKFMEEHGGFSFLKPSIPNLFADKFKAEHPDVLERLFEKAKSFSTESLIANYKAMMKREDRTDVLKTSDVPVFFVLATEDAPAPMEDVLQQVHMPAISYIHVIENAGHMTLLETPSAVNNFLLAFINDVK